MSCNEGEQLISAEAAHLSRMKQSKPCPVLLDKMYCFVINHYARSVKDIFTC